MGLSFALLLAFLIFVRYFFNDFDVILALQINVLPFVLFQLLSVGNFFV